MKNIINSEFVAEELSFAKELATLEERTGEQEIFAIDYNTTERVFDLLEKSNFKPTRVGTVEVANISPTQNRYRVPVTPNTLGWSEYKIQTSDRGNIMESYFSTVPGSYKRFQAGNLKVEFENEKEGFRNYILTIK